VIQKVKRPTRGNRSMGTSDAVSVAGFSLSDSTFAKTVRKSQVFERDRAGDVGTMSRLLGQSLYGMVDDRETNLQRSRSNMGSRQCENRSLMGLAAVLLLDLCKVAPSVRSHVWPVFFLVGQPTLISSRFLICTFLSGTRFCHCLYPSRGRGGEDA
jgi:hypothetical protein